MVQGLRDKGLTPVTVTTLLDDDLQAGAVYYVTVPSVAAGGRSHRR